jgi:hypothetical protein
LEEAIGSAAAASKKDEEKSLLDFRLGSGE